jgi:hypothetical protein
MGFTTAQSQTTQRTGARSTMSSNIDLEKDNNFSESKAKAKSKRKIRYKITAAEKEAFYMLSTLLRHVRVGIMYWDELSPADKIKLETDYREQLLEFIDFGNRYVNSSLHYRLREKEPEEE